ncbi:MAG: hypothetical protein P8Z38_04735 [Robiginitalea sp.]
MLHFFNKVRKYLIEAFVIFLGVMMAFITENWRDDLQDAEDFRRIMQEIEKDIRLDSVEMQSDKNRIIRQIDCIDRLLNDSLGLLGLPKGSRPNRTCLDLIMIYDWPDYVTTGYHQLENSKIVPAGYDDNLMMKIYEYYQWIDYHYLNVGPAIDDVQELQKYFIRMGFAPIEKDTITESEAIAFQKIQKDSVFVTLLKYLKYNRKEELRIYEVMERKSAALLRMFRDPH